MQRVLVRWMLLLSLLLPLAGHAQAPPPEPDIRVVLLGTAGGPVIRANRCSRGRRKDGARHSASSAR